MTQLSFLCLSCLAHEYVKVMPRECPKCNSILVVPRHGQWDTADRVGKADMCVGGTDDE
jgi:hypothetical protein